MVNNYNCDTILLVANGWQALKQISNYQEVAGCMLYERLFELCPKAHSLFGFPSYVDPMGDYSKLMTAQAKQLIGMLDKVINMLGSDAEMMTEILQDLGRRHEQYGVEMFMYHYMGLALMYVLEQQLQENFTPKMKEAWEVVYHGIVYNMTNF